MNAMANPPSVALPENAERRAAITSGIQAATGLDEAVLEHLVRAFYATARQDEVIGHLFDGVVDWVPRAFAPTNPVQMATGWV
jgi:hypothetical protein